MFQPDFSHRCSTARVCIKDQNGKPIANTKVRAKLTNHEFLFGSGAFDVLPLASDLPVDQIAFYQDNDHLQRAFYQDRMDKWTKVFNFGTIPFYWAGYEPEEGNVQFESRMNSAKYLIAHNAKVKGHPLCWHTECAKWLMNYDEKTIMDKLLNRINRDVTAFKGVIDIWDVINETVILPVYDRYDNAISRLCKKYGRLELIKEVFAATQAANPDSVMLINDFDLSEAYERVIEECLEAGVPISAIGMQSHQHQGYRGMGWMEEVVNRYSRFGIPLHFTENTLVSGDIMPAHIVDLNDYQVDEWPSTPEGEARQAEEWKEMYTYLFAEPSVEAITGWDFADGAWLHAPSGIVRIDNTEKPAYYTLKKLIHEEWTTDVELVTDQNGYITLTGFRGDYLVESAQGKAALYLGKDFKDITVDLT